MLVRLLCGARAVWLGSAPPNGVCIFFANHTSNLDPVVLWSALPSFIRIRTRPVAAQDYWTKSSLRLFLATRVFRALLIERRNVTVRNNPLAKMLEALDAADSLIIFPEGGRFAGPEPQEFKSGLYHLARQRPNVPLVPVYLENLNRVLPKGEFLPVPLLGSVTLGSPISLNPGESKLDFLSRARLASWNLHRL